MIAAGWPPHSSQEALQVLAGQAGQGEGCAERLHSRPAILHGLEAMDAERFSKFKGQTNGVRAQASTGRTALSVMARTPVVSVPGTRVAMSNRNRMW